MKGENQRKQATVSKGVQHSARGKVLIFGHRRQVVLQVIKAYPSQLKRPQIHTPKGKLEGTARAYLPVANIEGGRGGTVANEVEWCVSSSLHWETGGVPSTL